MFLEVCVDCLESAANAVHNGADELEVCSDLHNGGLTPSLSLVKEIIDMINDHVRNSDSAKKTKVNVMIRSNTGWDFRYNKTEVEQMIKDIKNFKELNIDRFVFGALTDNGYVDTETCREIVVTAKPKQVTFHRAFDVCSEPNTAIKDIIVLGFDRLLTSGHELSAAEPEAVALIKKILNDYGNDIQIMPGAGINVDNVMIFAKMGCQIVHGSFRNGTVTDGSIVKRVKESLD